MLSSKRWAAATLVGVLAGFVGGLLGVGGGIIVVPFLVLVLGLSQYQASGTSTATIAVAAAVAVVVFGIDEQVDVTAAGWLIVGAAAGAVVGARYLERIPAAWLTRGFAAVMVVAAVRMLIT